MRIKTYGLFINEGNDNLNFEFLVGVGKMKEAIIRIVELHEKHYYNDTKISTNDRFIQSITDLIDMSINGEFIIAEDYLELVKTFEKELYDKQLIFSSEESLFGSIDDLTCKFNSILDNKDRDEEDIDRLIEDSEHVLKNMDDSWIYKDDEGNDESDNEFSEIIDNIDSKFIEDDDMWSSEEEFEKDMSDYIGKPIKDFDYSDRLQVYKYIEDKSWIKNALNSDDEEYKNSIQNLLSQIKNNLGI